MKKYTETDFEQHITNSLIEAGWTERHFSEYKRELCLLPEVLLGFIQRSQEKTYQKLVDQYGSETDSKLLVRIDSQIAKKGVHEVLRSGIKDRGCHFSLVYFPPKSGLNPDHAELYKFNELNVVRQLHYSTRNENSIDLVYFINGIPIVTMELKNQLTGQNITNAEWQYKKDRDPREPLLKFKRCLAHFCVDNDRASMTTKLAGTSTFFLPYNKGIVNPIDPTGHKTTYIWKEVLNSWSILDIIENYVHLAIEEKKKWDSVKKKVEAKTSETLIFPRFHQLEVTRQLREAVIDEGAGQNYLIQHTTGAGKSFEIAWLGHMLSSLYPDKTSTDRIFDSIIIITDRRVLDRQLRNTVKQFQRTKGLVKAAEYNSQQLKKFLEDGKDIIISTIQKFPVISESMTDLPGKNFAVIVDEVHSSMGGKSAQALKDTLTPLDEEENEEYQDIDEVVLSRMRSHGKQGHISFFGFTGTPKNKTLEIFGRKNEEGQFVPFHRYSMRQSIHECKFRAY